MVCRRRIKCITDHAGDMSNGAGCCCAFSADLVLTPGPEVWEAPSPAPTTARENPSYLMPQQFANPAKPGDPPRDHG